MLSVCIPTYNRTTLLYESFAQVLNDPRVSEIVIVDDNSDWDLYDDIAYTIRENKWDKVKLFRNQKNLDCYRNKREAVSKATNEWVVLLDSDNVITPAYLNALFNVPHPDKFRLGTVLYQPSFAMPHFDFRRFESLLIDKGCVGKYMPVTNFETMLNAMNFVVNRDKFLRIWDGSVDPVTSDSIYFNYKWLEAGNSIYVVPGMHYEHRVHDGSHYKNNNRRTPKGFHEDIVQRLKNMR